jgi:hypothetical protein
MYFFLDKSFVTLYLPVGIFDEGKIGWLEKGERACLRTKTKRNS